MSRIYLGDCLDVLQRYVPDSAANLIMTSPPYGVGGEKSGEFISWFLKRAEEFKRVLTPDGSFILNIGPHVANGEVTSYVDDLVAALRETWCHKHIYHWRKLNPVPTSKAAHRLRNAIEPCYHFALRNKPAFYPEQVRTMSTKRLVLPDNVIEAAVETRPLHRLYGDPRDDGKAKGSVPSFIRGRRCCIPFPEKLPGFFIELLTKRGDVVLDPFSGTGTTAKAAQDRGRRFTAIEEDPAKIRLTINRLQDKRNPNPRKREAC
jgi:site-specific DNA-methyltransferase (adenine-specific)